MSKGRLEGKVALVTGAGSGFGAAIAKRFTKEGAKVIIADISDEGAQKTAEACGEGTCMVLHMNVTEEADWQKALSTALGKWYKIDIVINNAGTSYKNKPSLQVTIDEFQKCFDVNVKSLYWSSQVVIPQMQKQGHGGSIVNISSIGALRPRPGLVWYNASKSAVLNATKALAAEYGPDQIRVNGVLPLISGTGLFENFAGVPYTEENVKKFLGNVPLGRLTDVEDVANACVFFASDESSFVTGTNLEIDGGRGV